jgi:hypothetical protein
MSLVSDFAAASVWPLPQAGTPPLTQHFIGLAPLPAWYLPLVFFPGILFWGCVSFLLIERPGLRLGQYLLKRQQPRGISEAPTHRAA